MIQFHGREYWSLQETAKWLDLPQSTTLKHLRREALLRFKGQGIKKAALHEDGDFDIDKIRWIDGFFWLPIDAYLEFDELLSGGIKSISFSELEPQIIKIKDRLDCGTQRCDPAMGIWLPIAYPDLTEIRLHNLDDLYFWEETVKDFARREEIHIPLADNMLPLDVVIKQLDNQVSPTADTQKPEPDKILPSDIIKQLNKYDSENNINPNIEKTEDTSPTRVVAWKSALYFAWPKILHKNPNANARIVIDYLKKYDDTGSIMQGGDKDTLCWIGVNGQKNETKLKTIQNEISRLRKLSLQKVVPDDSPD